MTPQKVRRVARDEATSFDPSTLITVVVGREPHLKKFAAHEGIICARSEFFLRALTGNWVEKEERVVKFPEDDPDVFSSYMNLVYTNKVVQERSDRSDLNPALYKEYVDLSRLYILCEKLQDTAAKNVVIATIWDNLQEVDKDGKAILPSSEAIKIIYEGTLQGNLARKFITHSWIAVHDKFLGDEDSQKLPREFWNRFGSCTQKRNEP